MNLTVAYEPITELLRNAYAEGRQFLYEYEVYNLLSLSGSETPPKCSFIPRNARLADEEDRLADHHPQNGSRRRAHRAENAG